MLSAAAMLAVITGGVCIVLENSEPVRCGNCGGFVSTYGELKRRFERALPWKSTVSAVSGC
jgi:hypothetical protein